MELSEFGVFPEPGNAIFFVSLSHLLRFKKKKKTLTTTTTSVFELLSSLPNYGASSSSSSSSSSVRVARTTWRDAEKCHWSVSRASPSAAAAASSPKERPTGKAWGFLTWDGSAKEGTAERPVRIPGARKRVWRLVGEGEEGNGAEGGGGKGSSSRGWKSPTSTTS